MTPENGSRLRLEDLSAVINAQARFGGTTAVQPLVDRNEDPAPDEFAAKNGHHPPDYPTETAGDTPQEAEPPTPPKQVDTEGQPPAAA